jgi:hypothetical protein
VNHDAAGTIFEHALWVEAGFASDCMKRNTTCEWKVDRVKRGRVILKVMKSDDVPGGALNGMRFRVLFH